MRASLAVIRVNVPRMTKESREQLAKHAKLLAETARTGVRGVRQRAMKTAKGEGSKEEVKRSEKKVEDATKAAVVRHHRTLTPDPAIELAAGTR